MEFVRELLRNKGHQLWSVTPQTSVFDALALMAEKNIGATVVVDESGALEGIFSERDYARKVVLKGKSSRELRVSEIMTTKVYSVDPGQKISECMELMTDHRIRHLPVVENGKLLGIISIGDVVKSIIEKQESVIEQLESYITGRG